MKCSLLQNVGVDYRNKL